MIDSGSIQSVASTFEPLPAHALLPVEMGVADPDLTFHDILQIVIRGRLLLITLALLGLLAGVTWALRAPKQYTSTATLEVNRVNDRGSEFNDLSGLAPDLGGAEEVSTDLETQQNIVESDATLIAAVKASGILSSTAYALTAKEVAMSKYASETDPDIAKTPHRRERILNLIRAHLKVSIVKGARLIAITFRDTDPGRARMMAEAIASQYLEGHIASRIQASEQVSAWLKKRLDSLKDEAEEAQITATKVQDQSGLVDANINLDRDTAGTSSNSTVTRYTDLYRQATRSQNEVREREEIYRQTKKLDLDATLSLAADLPSDPSDSSKGPVDLQSLRATRSHLAQLDLQLTDANQKYGSKNSDLIRLTNERSALVGQIHEELVHINDQAREAYESARQSADRQQEAVNTQQGQVHVANQQSDRVRLLAADSNTKRRLYENLLSKVDQASIAGGLRASDITFVDHALTPANYASPRLLKSAVVSLTGSLLLGLLAIFVLALGDDRLYTLSSLGSAGGMFMPTTIPVEPRRGLWATLCGLTSMTDHTTPVELWKNAAPSSYKEAYRQFRGILTATNGKSAKTIVFASSSAEEHTEQPVAALAAGCSLLYLRTLLIDTRWQHRGFQGLRFEGQLGHVLTETDFTSLCYLTAEAAGATSPEFFASIEGRSALAVLKKSFDVILVYSAPGTTAEPLNLAAEAEAVVVVARSAVTRRQPLKELIRTFEQNTNAPIRLLVTNHGNQA